MDDLIEGLELMLQNIDNKIRPENAVTVLKFEEWLVKSKDLEYVCSLLGVKTEDLKKDILRVEEGLGSHKKMIKFRQNVADLLERAKKLKSQGKELAIIPMIARPNKIA